MSTWRCDMFPNQTTCNPFNVWSDADHAGCIRTQCFRRRAHLTHGPRVLLGNIKRRSKGCLPQQWRTRVLWLSFTSLPNAWTCFNCKGSDASIGTQYPWAQERAARKEFHVSKDSAGSMLTSVLTKPVTEEKINMAMIFWKVSVS